MRRHYIDNLRTFAVLMLFAYHAAMIFNSFESFYIHVRPVGAMNMFITLAWPFYMPLLFALAGISSAYALAKRNARQYVAERVRRLLIPLLSGILLLVPMQTYFAERYHNGYTGSYFAQYILFFTKPTDLTGYHGGFTPGQLWFVLYLIVISLLALPPMLWYNNRGTSIDASKLTLPVLLPMFVLPLVLSPVLNIGGKGVGEYFAYFMLGFLLLCRDEVVECLRRHRWLLIALAALLLVVNALLYSRLSGNLSLITDILSRAAGWTAVLALLGAGRQWLDFTNRSLTYLAKASFTIYVFHQSWLVAAAYYVCRATDSTPVIFILTIVISLVLTIASYEVVKRFRVTRWMFGLEGAKKVSNKKGEITL